MAVDDVPESFIQLVKTVMTDEVSRAIAEGSVEVHIGFHEVEVNDTTEYDESLIRPYVHISSK